MRPAKHTRYANKDLEASQSSARRGTSTTLNLSEDRRRLVSKTKPVNLPTKKATPAPTPSSSILNAALNRVRQTRRDSSTANDDYGAYLLDLERDFYDTNSGGFDDDYVETNVDGEEGGVPVAPSTVNVCDLDDQGAVMSITGEDAHKARNFAAVSSKASLR